MDFSRRDLLLFAAATVIQGGASQKQDMLPRSARPEDLEMSLAGFSEYITPIDRFFVRTHVYEPTVDAAAWRLTVEGETAGPLTLTIDDLRAMPSVEQIAVAECAGNGRGFYEPSMPGLQWGHGAVGNGRWKGVRLADVLRRAGVKPTAKEILFDGADGPVGSMPDFQRSIPVKKALDGFTLLAYEMNGAPLPAKHGFPLRVVTPGWASDSWMKWVTKITALDHEHDGFWMKTAYRHPGKPVAPGTAIPPDQMQPVTSLRVKSVIAAPREGAQIRVGAATTIAGVAWSGDAGPVTAVDVSVDGGRTWKAARLNASQRTPFGWRQWDFQWTPASEAYHMILARARDASGATQPLDQEWNPSGYGWNVVPRVGVDVVRELAPAPSPSAAPAAPPAPTEDDRPAVFRTACLSCHSDDVIRQQRLTRGQWDREVTKMTGWGARVSDQDRSALLDFLSSRYGPRPRLR